MKFSQTERLSRRSILRTLGISGTAAFLPSLRPRSAGAARIPTRVLFFWNGSGVARQGNVFRSASGGTPTESDFVFPDQRAPLNAIKKDLITFENLDMVSASVDKTMAANAHYNGETHSLAATNRATADTAGGPSIDQYIANSINAKGPVTKFPSLSLGVSVSGFEYVKVCTPGPGQVISLDISPTNAYRRVFSGFIPPSASAPTGPTPAQLLAQQKQSVLDTVLADFAEARGRLSRAEVAKLDAHASAVRDLEKRLALNVDPASTGAGCKDPMPNLQGTGNTYPGTGEMMEANFNAMARVVQSAFACDLTRVVLLGFNQPKDSQVGYTSGAWGTTDLHDVIHKTSYNPAGTLKDNPDAMAVVSRLHQLEASQLVTMMDLLRQVPESDGRTLLDHTIVLWCSQIGEHGHDLKQLPWVLGGGSAAGFRTGRYLRFDRANDRGMPHNNLFVSIAQAMGVQTDTFGNPDVCTGPLAGLRT
jgi:hypothetical protein